MVRSVRHRFLQSVVLATIWLGAGDGASANMQITPSKPEAPDKADSAGKSGVARKPARSQDRTDEPGGANDGPRRAPASRAISDKCADELTRQSLGEPANPGPAAVDPACR